MNSTRRWPFLPGRDIAIESARGVYLYDRSGKQILDAAGGAVVCNIGHGRERVANAVAEATLQTSYVVPPWLTPSRTAMLEALDSWLPDELTRVHGTSGGSEAVEAAIKIALHYQQGIGEHQRTLILGRSLSYHGTTLATAAISGHPLRKKGLEGALPDFPEVATPYPLRCPLGAHHEDCADYYVGQFEQTIAEIGAQHVAAYLAEPIIGSSGGAIVPPTDYWPRIARICRDAGILLVLDEVMTGFGRTGTDFGHQHWPITPDILVSGKGLAGGYAPLGGVFATEAVGQALEAGGYQVMFNTFGAHPAACAAAAQVLMILREEDLVARAARMGEKLQARLRSAFADHPHVAECRGLGLLQAIEIVQDRQTLEPFAAEQMVSNRVVAKGLEQGVFFYGGGTGAVRDIVCMGPPLIIEDTHIDQIVDTLRDCVDAVTLS